MVISLGFRKKMILVLAFSADIEWGWVPKNSQPPGEVNTKNYQNDFFKGVNMENIIALGLVIIWAVIGAIAYAVIAQREDK